MVTRSTALKQLDFLDSKGKKMRLAAEGWHNDWQKLVAISLSARTRDEVTILVCDKMFEKFPTPFKFSKLNLSNIKRLIYNVNFFENKSRYIYNMTQEIIKKYDGKIPHNFEKLIELPGVGRKTANVFLAEDGGANIGVDTHVSYISQYLNWVNSSKPEIIEKQLEKLFPKSKWGIVNRTLVRFGKTYTSKKQKDTWLDYIKKNVK